MKIQNTLVFTSQQIRACEKLAIENKGITPDELMESAGQAAFMTMTKQFPAAKTITVFCGSGNNAGDGYVLARIAQEHGFTVFINQYKTVENLPETARHAAIKALASGLICQYLEDPIDSDTDVIIDALLGIGLQGEVNAPLSTAINIINDSGLPVLSIDIPSGLNSDTGQVMGVCVKANVTTTFIAKKLGMLTLDGPDHCGHLVVHDLHLKHCLAAISPAAQIMSENQFSTLLKNRPKNSHKGMFGHVLAIGGGLGMPGSICLTAEAALRIGAGLVTVATRPEHVEFIPARLPEVMVYGIDDLSLLPPLLAKATVCVIGPGLGDDEWAINLFKQVIASQLPMVIDASALHILAEDPQHDDNWVLTPHPGEAAKLLEVTTLEVQHNRYKAVLALQKKYGGNIVLKGVGSLIQTDNNETWLCTAGNPGMASPGMGDVLSGVIAGLMAQGLPMSEASTFGVLIHARAGDKAAQDFGERGLLAQDLMPFLRMLVNRKDVYK